VVEEGVPRLSVTGFQIEAFEQQFFLDEAE
jgi:hypothetical protein